MRWIAWGLHVVDGEAAPHIVGELDSPNITAALVNARRLYGQLRVDHVQSVLSHEIDLLEKERLVFNRHHPRRSPEKQIPNFGVTSAQ